MHKAVVAEIRVLMTVEAAWHQVPGGTARVALDLASALDERPDIQVQGLAAMHRKKALGDWRPSINVSHHRLPRLLLYESWSRSQWPKAKCSNSADLIHSTTIITPPASSIPLVVNVHDLAFRKFPDRFPKRARLLFERSWKRVLERADAVLSPSKATSDDLRAGGLDRGKLHLIPLGHNPIEVSEIVQASTSKKFGIGEQFILAAGTLEPRKNVPSLLKAFEKIVHETESQLVLAGPIGWGVSVSQLLGSVSKATQDKIIVTGAVSREELAALYFRATAFCYPSLLEGFGLPVLEAMSYGTAVVTSKDRSTEEVAGVAALTVDPLSVDEIAEALRLVLTDASVAKELGDLGRERAKLFTWKAAAASTVDVYRSLL